MLMRRCALAYLLTALLVGATFTLTTGTSAVAADSVTLIAVQMQVSPEQYQSAETFYQAADSCMQAASSHFGSGPTMVVFPEDVGLGLLFAGYYDFVQGASSFQEAAYTIAYFYAAEIQALILQYQCSLARALLLARGDVIQQIYYDTFSQLAQNYGVTIVAGSAPIPGPDGTVYNTCYVFGPDGSMLGQQRKVHLIDLEMEAGLDLNSGDLADIHAIDTPVGRIGVAICLDAFYDDVVDDLESEGAEILVQPSFNPQPWTHRQAAEWRLGIWMDVQTDRGWVAGVNPMMVGALWDIVPEGQSSIVGQAPRGYLVQAPQWTQEAILSATVDVDD